MPLFNADKRRAARMRRIKVIAVDLDGTLLTNDSKITQDTVDAIKTAREEGLNIIIASGRSPGFIRAYQRVIEGTAPIIALNGALALDTVAGLPLYSSTLKPAVADIIKTAIGEEPAGITAWTPDGIVTEANELPVPRYLKTLCGEYNVVQDIRVAADRAVFYLVCGSYNGVQAASVALAQKFGNRIARTMYSSNEQNNRFYLEVRSFAANKGNALYSVCKRLKISASQVAAIGDYTNDIEMLRYAGVAAAMRNGTNDVRDIADIVTRNTNEDGGVAEFIQLIMKAKKGE